MTFQIQKIENQIFKPSISGNIKRLVELFVKDYLSPCTKSAYAKDIQRFFQFCLNKGYIFNHPRDIQSIHLREYRDWLLSEGYQNSTVIRHMASLRQLMNYCVIEGVVDRNPLLNVQYPKHKNISTTNAFTDEEVKQMLLLPHRESYSGLLHYTVLLTLFYLGLRKSELVNLRTSDFVEERNHFAVRICGKGNKIRTIAIQPFIRTALENYLKASNRVFAKDDFMFKPVRNNFSKDTDKPLHPETINWIVWRYAQKAGVVKNISPHSCRATVVSNLLDKKIPIVNVAVMMGHSSPTTTMLYSKRHDDLDQSAAYNVNY